MLFIRIYEGVFSTTHKKFEDQIAEFFFFNKLDLVLFIIFF